MPRTRQEIVIVDMLLGIVLRTVENEKHMKHAPRPPRAFRSFCIAKDQPECHYRLRRPLPAKPSRKSHRRTGDGASNSSAPPPPAEGRSFWPTAEEKAAQDEISRAFGRGVPMLPLKRYGEKGGSRLSFY